MDLIRVLVATLLMACAGHSQALFMPEGFTVNTDAAVPADDGCGAIMTVAPDTATH